MMDILYFVSLLFSHSDASGYVSGYVSASIDRYANVTKPSPPPGSLHHCSPDPFGTSFYHLEGYAVREGYVGRRGRGRGWDEGYDRSLRLLSSFFSLFVSPFKHPPDPTCMQRERMRGREQLRSLSHRIPEGTIES